jgi:tetratricopeptide (TPR) repeat protein
LYYQQKDDLSKALDSLRQAIFYEKQLGDNTANTCLTSAVFL